MLSLLIPILLWSLPPGTVPVRSHPTEFKVGMTMAEARVVLEDKGWAFEVHRDDVLVGNTAHSVETLGIANYERRITRGEPYELVFEDGVCVRVSR